jgi:Ca2+/Na+ antiporter
MIHPIQIQFNPALDIAVIIFATALLMLFGAINKKHLLPRWSGLIFLIGYGIYLAYLILRG